ncbi:motile sperm domain-containing protein 2 isoform X2 [Stomoxys calcitrans]|uniref:MSP domain-containing protein n=1 Tax=Stomoxys calcitrans TaxID=35570 RepID=A0A1I8QF51_STOCA|nr:motile sperm domain-containing protein 2 isoform X2 [Stomoxys calcitrans]
MPIKTMTPSKQQIDELRNMFIQKYENNPPAVDFHPVDIDRVRNDDLWCTRFLEMYDLDMQMSFDKLWNTCIWRQSFRANDLNESNVRKDYLQDGVIFPHNTDVDGKPLLIFKTKKHIKGSKDMNEILKVLVYWIERIHRETYMEKITIFFDMDGCGLSNMDLEFIKMIIDTFKQYYPNALNYILVFEMAWVLNAAFKIVKALLPEKAVEILKIITKKTIDTYVDKDNCLASWGGNDNYEFTFTPEVKKLKVNGSVPTEDPNNNVQDKKVHFANSSPTRVPAVAPIHMHEPDHSPQEQAMLEISPSDELKFSRDDSNDGEIKLTCKSSTPVAYKIQTTSPDKFRVKPRCGILNPGETVVVNILLKPEHKLSGNGKDKFLIMCVPALDVQPQHVVEYWRKVGQDSPDMENYRFLCSYTDDDKSTPKVIANGVGSSPVDNARDYSATETRKLEKQLKFTQTLQWITLVVLFILSIAVIYLLKLQIVNDEGCLSKDGLADAVDFATCAKGKADL